MENGDFSGVNKRKISAEDVLTKLKDDGDFDRLRLKIIRQLKDDGELRNNIISVVRQSAVLNRSGAENMKPRQLSDAIHQEIGDKVMSQISDGVWKIIRSGEGMKTEITETVQLVYNKLLNPKVNEDGKLSSPTDMQPEQKGHDGSGGTAASASEIDGRLSDCEPNEPPGFTLSDHHRIEKSNQDDLPKERPGISKPYASEARAEPIKEIMSITDTLETDRVNNSAPLCFPEAIDHKQSGDGSDEEDPDVPPGFG